MSNTRPMTISDACTEIFRLEAMVRELRAEVERSKADAERWRKASSSRNLGIAFWGEHGQGIVYDKAAEIHTDRVIKADAARSTASGAAPLGDWRIDHSAGRPILVYKDCSVIEAEQAYYVLNLLKAAENKP